MQRGRWSRLKKCQSCIYRWLRWRTEWVRKVNVISFEKLKSRCMSDTIQWGPSSHHNSTRHDAGPNLVKKDVMLTFLTPLFRPMKTSLRPAEDAAFKVSSVIRCLLNLEWKPLTLCLELPQYWPPRRYLAKHLLISILSLSNPSSVVSFQ